VISYAAKGQFTESLNSKTISSIVANEFLLVQSESPAQANYYVPMPSPSLYRFLSSGGLSKLGRRHRLSKRFTDRTVMDFGADYPTVIEFGNIALAYAINRRERLLFSGAIRSLEKAKQKTIKRRFDFLLASGVNCIPLNRGIVTLAQELLAEYTRNHNLKREFRNSWNDLLILATAISQSARLITQDNELSRFAAEQHGALTQWDEHFAGVNFNARDRTTELEKAESKGYINKSWSVSFRKFGNKPRR
jgi:predicted nucleic acid-binding protein